MIQAVPGHDSALHYQAEPQRGSRPLPNSNLIVITNRQPDPATVASQGNSGGVVAALAPVLEQAGGTWIGGAPTGRDDAPTVQTDSSGSYHTVAVAYPEQLHEGFYAGFSNGVLWPLYHSMPHEARACRPSHWRDYVRVNRHFAAAAAGQCRPGSFVWIHDYQLSLLPRLLREATSGTEIGFFLHTPFPAYDIFRALPWGREILEGMLGAGLIGFQVDAYRRNFCECVRRLLGVACELDAQSIEFDGRVVKLRAIPVGIDAGAVDRWARDPWVCKTARRLRAQLGGHRLLLGVDRMDYTKGIDRRIEAVDLLLERYPEWRGNVVFAQIAVPSRTDVEPYQVLRSRLEQLAGGVNGRWSQEDWSPVKLLCRSYPLRELVAWYLAADVALVTPFRDGMNLVAKEYCAAHHDGSGVLILSELTGAADELREAVLINPYDPEGLADAIHQGLTLPEAEARSRMHCLSRRVHGWDAHCWVEAFLAAAG